MITKELKVKKYCCFYASDFHLEMILLPYIKKQLDKKEILICTQNKLEESLKIVLNRINLEDKEKSDIIDIDWNKNELELSEIKENDIIIINGDQIYIEEINNEILNLELQNITLINCFDINKIKEIRFDVTKEYEGILNTNYYT